MATLSIHPVSHTSADNDAVTCELFIAAPRERVFEALTDPKQAAQWWGQKPSITMDNFSMDVRPGGKWSTTGLSAANGPIRFMANFSKSIRRDGCSTPGSQVGCRRSPRFFGNWKT